MNEETEGSFISISERAYKYIRQFTIKNVTDALIEVITNCIDAYGKTSYLERYIQIKLIGEKRIMVTDWALGLTASELTQCFLQVGNFTSDSSSRGFFSRGAKDISALGNVTFDAIKNGMYSQCYLDTDAYGYSTISDIPVTEEIRRKLNIPGESNGLCLTLDLLRNFQGLDASRIYDTVCNLAVFRDINMDPRNKIILCKYDDDGNQIFENRVSYTPPAGKEILDIEYTIPGYPNETARMVIFQADKPIPQPVEESCLEFGFLIRDDYTVYEINTIDSKYRWNPYINYLYGFITTTAIKKYLMDFDRNGASTENPYPIIDPSRLSGVNKVHPLIKGIYAIPLVRIDAILRELNNSVATKTVTIEDINELLGTLAELGLDIIKTNNVSVGFKPTYDANLAQAIKDDRANYVRYEKSHVVNGEYYARDVEIDDYVRDQIINLYQSNTTDYFYLGPDKSLLQVQSRDIKAGPTRKIIDLLTQSEIDALKTNPYVYRLASNGKHVERLYIFQKGIIDDESAAPNINIKNRQFSIQFINDLNLAERYVIDNTNGVVINLNLNNPIIAKYLTNKDIDSLDDLISLDVLRSTNSLLFLETLVTDIFADLIMQSDVSNGKLKLDGNDYDNSQKILSYRNKIITRLEIPLDKIFGKYKGNVINTKKEAIDAKIASIGQALTELGGLGIPQERLSELAAGMRAVVQGVLE
jgi:hypothetical protein